MDAEIYRRSTFRCVKSFHQEIRPESLDFVPRVGVRPVWSDDRFACCLEASSMTDRPHDVPDLVVSPDGRASMLAFEGMVEVKVFLAARALVGRFDDRPVVAERDRVHELVAIESGSRARCWMCRDPGPTLLLPLF